MLCFKDTLSNCSICRYDNCHYDVSKKTYLKFLLPAVTWLLLTSYVTVIVANPNTVKMCFYLQYSHYYTLHNPVIVT